MSKKTLPEVSVLERLRDPQYFIERFFWIVNKQRVIVPFLFNLPQKTFYDARSYYDLVLKARKEGFSTLVEALNLHACIFFPNENAVTMAQNQDETKVHGDRIRTFLETMGTKDIKWEIDLDDDNQTEMTFPDTNSHFWLGTAGARTFGRSRDITKLHCTEVAHYANQEVLTGVLNACVDTAWRVLETTANGVGEKFYQLWEEAGDAAAKSSWKRHFFAWWMDPTNVRAPEKNFVASEQEREMRTAIQSEFKFKITDEQIFWYRQKRAEQTDKSKMPQEFPSNAREAFLSSGRTIFNIQKLEIMRKRANPPQLIGELRDDAHTLDFFDRSDGPLTIWKSYRPDRKYLIAADVAEGVAGGAYSVGAVFDRSSWEVAAELRLHVDPGEFGRMLCALGEFYNWGILIPELNNHGHATLEAIKEKRYPHILKTTDIWPDERERYGFPTDDRTKEKIISALRNAVDELSYFENSQVAIREMQRAVRDKNGKMVSMGATPEDGKRLNLDCVITRAIGLYCLKFLTLDETYRENPRAGQAMLVSSVAGSRAERKEAAWRR